MKNLTWLNENGLTEIPKLSFRINTTFARKMKNLFI
jgi:hypothetical protein